MLRPNPALPPRPSPSAASPRTGDQESVVVETVGWYSPEDFDATGILTGIDPCESRYWWLAELHADPGPTGSDAPVLLEPPALPKRSRPGNQATARRTPPPAAA